jgi:hypothetical protein
MMAGIAEKYSETGRQQCKLKNSLHLLAWLPQGGKEVKASTPR